MIVFPEHLLAHDIPHLGALFRRIRTVRGLSQADIAQALHVTNSTISKFENTGRSRRAQIVNRYIRALQSPVINYSHVPCPLESDEAHLLLQLSLETLARTGHAVIDELSAYDLDLIASSYSPPALKELVQRLRQLRSPAFLSDGLGFIHGMNGAMLNLFGITPHSLLLQRWETWHVLGAYVMNPSPFRTALVDPDIYLPFLIRSFFRNTLLYLFTPQMRALLRELHLLSSCNGLHFSQWWYAATSFTIFYEQDVGACILRRDNLDSHAFRLEFETHWIQSAPTIRMPYYLAVWRPLGAETQPELEHLYGAASTGELYFAAAQDGSHQYHVNDWPDVVRELDELS